MQTTFFIKFDVIYLQSTTFKPSLEIQTTDDLIPQLQYQNQDLISWSIIMEKTNKLLNTEKGSRREANLLWPRQKEDEQLWRELYKKSKA